MKILLITGQIAKESVEKYTSEFSELVEVFAMPVSVASLLTPSQILAEIQKKDLKSFDMILVPGLVRKNVSIIEEASGIPTFKGPKYAADLPVILKIIESVKLSKTIPACEVLDDELLQKSRDELKSVEEISGFLVKKPGNMLIGNLAIGKDFPMRVMAEILDAPLLSSREIIDQAKYYVKCGAQIIDIGMISGESKPEDAVRAIRAVKSHVSIPVSIDTFDLQEVKAAILAGADLLLSVDSGNVEEVAEFASDIAVVVIPTNHKEKYFPKKPFERMKTLEENIRKAVKFGIKNVIGDLILDPINTPGMVESLIAYREFSSRNRNVPLLFGVGNVTELVDADSVGINALLAGIGSELGVNLLLTTEGSDKTKGSVKELVEASKMMFLAKKRNSTPKDLGLNLLILKDKKFRDEFYYEKNSEKEVQIIKAKNFRQEAIDPKGFFKIYVDKKERTIIASHFLGKNRKEIIKGRKAEQVYKTITHLGLISSLDHASYIGKELEKAEIALKIGKTYIQDEPLFR